jgi:hypothetical protein
MLSLSVVSAFGRCLFPCLSFRSEAEESAVTFAVACSPPSPKHRHLDRSCSWFHRDSTVERPPYFAVPPCCLRVVSAVACSLGCHSAAKRRNLLLTNLSAVKTSSAQPDIALPSRRALARLPALAFAVLLFRRSSREDADTFSGERIRRNLPIFNLVNTNVDPGYKSRRRPVHEASPHPLPSRRHPHHAS